MLVGPVRDGRNVPLQRGVAKVLEELSKLHVATLGNLWDLGEQDRASAKLPAALFDPQVQWAAIEDVFVLRNGVFLDDEPMPIGDAGLIHPGRPQYGYSYALLEIKEFTGLTIDRGIPKARTWKENSPVDKAWKNFIQDEDWINAYVSSADSQTDDAKINQLVAPPTVACPEPPEMKLDLGSKITLQMAKGEDLAFIGAAHIYTGIVYIFPLVPHPCYYGDYKGGESPDGSYRVDLDARERLKAEYGERPIRSAIRCTRPLSSSVLGYETGTNTRRPSPSRR